MAEASTIARMSISRSACPLVQWDVWDASAGNVRDFAVDRLGGPLPGEVGQMAALGATTAVKVSPRRFWLFTATRPGLPAGLGAELDLCEGRERLALRTPHLRGVLAQCLAVDWDRTLGRAAFAPMHNIPVMFSRSSAEEGVFVVPRTFARSIVDWLEDCL